VLNLELSKQKRNLQCIKAYHVILLRKQANAGTDSFIFLDAEGTCQNESNIASKIALRGKYQ